MFEKPQYFTKDGYKRLTKNPHKDDACTIKNSKNAVPTKRHIPTKSKPLSDEAAKMIAMVLKGMLNSK